MFLIYSKDWEASRALDRMLDGFEPPELTEVRAEGHKRRLTCLLRQFLVSLRRSGFAICTAAMRSKSSHNLELRVFIRSLMLDSIADARLDIKYHDK